MSYQAEREEFIARMTREGLDLETIRALLRAATTLQRYAELACSSEAADRDRVECPAATERLVRFRCACQQTEQPPPAACQSCNGRKYVERPIARKPTGPCLCDDWPAGSHTAGKHSKVTRITVQADRLERRIAKRLYEYRTPASQDRLRALSAPGLVLNDREKAERIALLEPQWSMETQGDPRGYVFRVIPPSYQERNQGKDRHNLDAIGVPSGPSRLRF